MFQGYRLEKDGHIHHGIGYLGLLGNTLVITYSVYFFELAGLETSQSFNLGVGVLAVGFIGPYLSWPLIAHYGRRPIYNYGLLMVTILLLLIGILDVLPNYTTHSSIPWAQSSLMVV